MSEIGTSQEWSAIYDAAVYGRLQENCPSAEVACVAEVMQDEGASQDAIAFFRSEESFLGAFTEVGRVDLGYLFNPWAANSNDSFVLLNGSPPVVNPNGQVLSVDLGLDPAYDSLKGTFPDLLVFPTAALIEAPADSYDAPTADGGQRFVFEYPIVDGCHACGTAYAARVALDFAEDGTYRGSEFLDVCEWTSSSGMRASHRVEPCPSEPIGD